MANGFVYVLLNPAFPTMVKIGLTEDISETRAHKLSSVTGVPLDFVVLYEALVSNVEEVEGALHKQFSSYRVNPKREFFYVAPKLAISALIDIAKKYPVTESQQTAIDDLIPYFKSKFPHYPIDQNIFSIRLMTVPGACFLRIGRDMNGTRDVSDEGLPLDGLLTPNPVTQEAIDFNARHLADSDEYTWIMIANVFSEDVANEIAKVWERPGGKLEKFRNSQGI